jgi:hypothetical protein
MNIHTNLNGCLEELTAANGELDRFTQSDMIRFNLYHYALSGLTWIDPWGDYPQDVVLIHKIS